MGVNLDNQVLSQYKGPIVSLINSNQQITYSDIKKNFPDLSEPNLSDILKSLEYEKRVISRNNGGILTYYSLQDSNQINKILIVEDDKNINKLMTLSIGKGYDIKQVYDGNDALKEIKSFEPNLVILDLMLPGADGLEICKYIKTNPDYSNMIVILVSAMDPTSNRFKGIKYGADYYIKKPFDPSELRNLVTLFLKKKGKRFDPLIDLPDEERISKEIERLLEEGGKYDIGVLSVENLGQYATRFGEHSAIVILRLLSQLLQDNIHDKPNMFVGFLNSESFFIAGPDDDIKSVVDEIDDEFKAVLPFIIQDIGYRNIDLDIDNLFESKEVPKLSLKYEKVYMDKMKERRDKILENRKLEGESIGSYTYDELKELFGKEKDLDVMITRDASGIKLKVSKSNHYDSDDAGSDGNSDSK